MYILEVFDIFEGWSWEAAHDDLEILRGLTVQFNNLGWRIIQVIEESS